MQIDYIMTKKVYSLKAFHKIMEAAKLMKNKNIGAIPITDDSFKLKGIITDRDIVLHLANGGSLEDEIENVMTKDVKTLKETDSLEDLGDLMGYSQIRRIPIVNDSNELLGIVSLGDLSTKSFETELTSDTLCEISYSPSDYCGSIYEFRKD